MIEKRNELSSPRPNSALKSDVEHVSNVLTISTSASARWETCPTSERQTTVARRSEFQSIHRAAELLHHLIGGQLGAISERAFVGGQATLA